MKRQPGPTAAAKPTTSVQSDPGQYLDVLEAKNRFISYTLGMGWRMAVSFIIPIIIGVKLDDHFDTAPSFTLVAFFVAVAASVVVVRGTLRDLKEVQAEADRDQQAQKDKKK